MKRVIYLLMTVVLLVGMLPVQPAVGESCDSMVVTNTDNSGPGSLRQAIVDVCPGGTITFNLAPEDLTITLSSELTIAKDLTINGSVGGERVTISGNETVRVFNVSSGVTVTLDSLKIIEGKAPGVSPDTGGGGISNAGTLLVKNSILASNFGSYGGGISNYSSGQLSVINSVIENNTGQFGGGIFNFNSGTIDVRNSIIRSNTVTSNGGGIAHNANSGELTIIDSTLSNNTSELGGGGIHAINTTTTVLGSTLVGNQSKDAHQGGGGIYNMQGTMTVVNSTLVNNTTEALGGGILNVSYGTLKLFNSTLSGNHATESSGGSGLRNASDGVLHFANTIIANSPSGDDCNNQATIATNINNLVEDGTCFENSTGFQSGDPMLDELADNGGLTKTMALLPGSPAIDAGDNDICSGALVGGVDQRGAMRDVGVKCDIGAFESGDVGPNFESVTVFASPSYPGDIVTLLVFLIDPEFPSSFQVSWGDGTGIKVYGHGVEMDRSWYEQYIYKNAGTYTITVWFTYPSEEGNRTEMFFLEHKVVDFKAYSYSIPVSNTNPTKIELWGEATGLFTDLTIFIDQGPETGSLDQRDDIPFTCEDWGGGVFYCLGEVTYTPDLCGEGLPECTRTDGFSFYIENSAGDRSNTAFITLNLAEPTTLTVNDSGDGGNDVCDEAQCTLRDAVESANNGDTIIFAEGLSGETIELDFTLHLDKDLTIDGSMLDAKVTISGRASTQVLNVTGDYIVTLDSLIIAEGHNTGGNGAGIYNNLGHLTVRNSEIKNNVTGISGGGIYNYLGVLTIENSHLTNNVAAVDGGGVYNVGGTLNIVNSLIEGNSADYGGGLASTYEDDDDGILTVVDSTIDNNSAIMGGGIDNQSFLTLSGSTLVGNKAEVYGGGINNGGDATVANSTFTGNGATDTGNLMGSAIFNVDTMTVYNSTFAGNTGSDTVFNELGGELSIANTIITEPGGDNVACKRDETTPEGIVEYTNNLIASGNCGATSAADPKLEALADNGGPTKTMALLPGSPAIDAGDNGICSGVLVGSVDQRGVSRPQPEGGDCDIGAYEYIETYPLVVNTLGDAGDGDCDATCTLRDAVLSAESGDTIEFDLDFDTPKTITLAGHIWINKSLTIVGPGADQLTISGGTVEHYSDTNEGDDVGGVFWVRGIYDPGVQPINVVISGLTIADGRARDGGGIFNGSNSTLEMTDCVIGPNNVAQEAGGGISNKFGTLTLNRCTVWGNSQSSVGDSIGGGGIATINDPATTTLINSTVSGNEAYDYGGGILVWSGGVVDLVHSTVTDNLAESGGGIFIHYVSGTTARPLNSIVAGNSATVEHPDVSGDFTTLGWNLIGDPTGSTNTWDESDIVDPEYLGLDTILALNGGSTQTHALLSGSPAIDAVACAEGITEDQRGVLRPQPEGGACDIGAYEYEHTVTYGGLKITKVFDPLTSGYTDTFAIDYDCGNGYANTVHLAASGTTTISGIPTGTICTVTEPNLPKHEGWTFGTPSYSPENGTVTISETIAEVTVTNTISQDSEDDLSQLTTARTKCDVYASEAAPELTKLQYTVRIDKKTGEASIHSISPATFLYYVTAVVPTNPSTLVITQRPDDGFPAMGASVTLYDESCARLSPQAAKVSIVDGNITIDFDPGLEGRTVYAAVSYTARSLRGQVVEFIEDLEKEISYYQDIDYFFSASFGENISFTYAELYLEWKQ